ncbi:MAG: substrate-binding domain-containing protein [Bacillota bacterium]
MKKKLSLLLVGILLLVAVFALSACDNSNVTGNPPAVAPENQVIRVSTTTSVNDSGLLPYLQQDFEAETEYKLEITSNGTGAAIKLGETGDADVLLVHAKASEEEFVANGYGIERIPFMYNYFVIVGPAEDAAAVKETANAADAFKAIATYGKTDFVSRGDDSGTNKAELKIWDAAGIDPTSNAWYVSAGAGMGAVLNQANERQAYTFTDKGTYLSMKNNLKLDLLLEESEDLKNTYSLIAVNPEKNQGINAEGAQAFIEWMTSDKTLEKISTYGVEEYGAPLFYPLD